jgi:hypothetical protein
MSKTSTWVPVKFGSLGNTKKYSYRWVNIDAQINNFEKIKQLKEFYKIEDLIDEGEDE